MNSDEIVTIVDASGATLRQALKTETHKHGWLHKTVIGCLRYGDDWVFVRQAADRQDAGLLVLPVGGHVMAGESDVQGLLREAEEEIGTRNITYKYVGQARFHRQVIGRDENHLFIVYEITTDDPIVLNHEAVALQRFTDDELRQALVDRPKIFGEGFYFVFEKFYPDYLPASWANRWD
ncbi:MAG: hydrolase [Candidatus Saccharibacteria bacterium]|nr:hydrolase [Candidatus Saccharibacteria bacterium]